MIGRWKRNVEEENRNVRKTGEERKKRMDVMEDV